MMIFYTYMLYTYMYTLVDTTKKDRFADGCMDGWLEKKIQKINRQMIFIFAKGDLLGHK